MESMKRLLPLLALVAACSSEPEPITETFGGVSTFEVGDEVVIASSFEVDRVVRTGDRARVWILAGACSVEAPLDGRVHDVDVVCDVPEFDLVFDVRSIVLEYEDGNHLLVAAEGFVDGEAATYTADMGLLP